MLAPYSEALAIWLFALPMVAALGGFLALLVAASHGVGRLLVAGSAVSFQEKLLLSAPIGMVLIAVVAFALAALGLLSPVSLAVVSMLLVGAAHRRWRRDLRESWSRLRAARRAQPKRLHRVLLLTGLGLAVVGSGLILLGFYPRMDFDETLYHLPFTRAMLETGSLPNLAYLRYPVFPNLQEASWTPLLAILGQSGPSAWSAVQTLWVGLLLLLWVGRKHSFCAGPLAAVLWLGCPIAWWTGTQALVDAGLALCVITAAYCLDRWEETPSSRWLVLAGVALGGAAATKYHGLLLLGLVSLSLLVGRRLKKRLAAVSLVVACAVAVALPVYGWITVTTSNPVFPFAAHTFGASEWSQHTRQTGGPEAVRSSTISTVVTVRANGALQKMDELPVTLADLTIPGRLESSPPLSIWFLLLIPAALFGVFRPVERRPRRWGLVFLAFFLIWFATARDPRYLFSVTALLVPLYVEGLVGMGRLLPRRLVGTIPFVMVCLVFLAPGVHFAAVELGGLGSLPIRGLERETFLRERRPGYHALRNAEAHWAIVSPGETPPEIFTLFGPDLQFFAVAPLRGDWYGPDRYSLFGDFRLPSIVERMRSEGFDYILEVHRRTPPTVGYYPGLYLVYEDERSKLWQIKR